MARWDNENVKFTQINEKDIVCKDCELAEYDGKFAPTKSGCLAFSIKPIEILTGEIKKCPYFVKK